MAVFSYDSRIDSEVGEVSLSPVGITASNSVVFNYTTESKEVYLEVDYNLITSVINLSNDYGFIADVVEGVINNGSISQDFSDGVFKPIGESQSSASSSYTGDGVIKIQEYKDKSTFIWVGNGTLFEIGGDITRIVAPGITGPPIGSSATKIYNTNISLEFVGESNNSKKVVFDQNLNVTNDPLNYGSLGAYQNSIDLGYVRDLNISSNENYGSILYDQIYGNISISNSSGTSRTTIYTGSGSIFNSGSAKVVSKLSTKTDTSISLFKVFGSATVVLNTPPVPDRSTLFRVFGNATVATNAPPVTKLFVGSGNVRVLSGSPNSKSYNYSISSPARTFSKDDFGSITTSGSVVNHGSVSVGSNTTFDYGLITVTETEFPYEGKVFVAGSATTRKYNVYTQVGSGTLNAISGFAGTIYQGKKKSESTDLFNVSGTPYITLTNKFVGSGSLSTAEGSANTETYNYNSSSILPYSTNNFGVITSVGVIDNYGYINNGSDREFNYGYLIDTDIKYPYGLFKISGSYQTFNRSFGHTSFGSINISGSSTTRLSDPTPQIYIEKDYGLYVVSGSAAPKRTFTARTTGSLFALNGSAPSVTYNYSSIAVEYTSVINYGTITSSGSSIDNGFITNPVDVYTDYVSIVIGEKATRFGPIITSGSSISLKVLNPECSGSLFAFNSSAESVFRPVQTDTVLFNIFSESTITLRAFGYESSGTLFAISDHAEKVAYNYHIDSVNLFERTDYELITSTGSSEDYGSIVLDQNNSFDYGYINISESVRAYGGSIKITGEPNVRFLPQLIYIGRGQFKVGGAVSTIGILSGKARPESSDLYNVSGTADTSFSRVTFTETSSFNTFSGAAEATAKVYNEFSINEFIEIDYEFITGSGSTIDYGLVFNNSNLTFNYGYIFDTQTVFPYGSIRISGTVLESRLVPNFAYSSTGSLFAARGSADTRAFAQTQDNETRLFNVYGSALTSPVTPYISSGSLFNIGSNIESATYAYNPSSILIFTNSDYGYVTSATDTTFDYGLVSESSIGDINLGYIVNEQTLYPHGRFTLAGQSSVEFYRRPSYAGSGSLFEYSGSAETRSFSEGKDSQTRLFNVYGSANTPFSRPYITTGSLFEIGSTDESRTYVYNQSSITTFSSSDYEFISSIADVYNDYGLISESSVGDINSGYITEIGTTYPFGTIKVTNTAGQNVTAVYRGSGSLFAITSTAESSAKTTQTETSLFTISGVSNNIISFGYAGTGSLFDIGTKIEKATYSYNTSSTTTFSSDDYGYVTSAVDTTIDYGLISESSVGDINYGYITETGITHPFGKFTISGSASTTAPAIYSGAGSLFTIGGRSQATVKSVVSETSLFTISGVSRNIISFGYAGTGSLFDIGTKIESRTYVYDSSAIIEFNTLNYEDIGEGPIVFENYGDISDGSSIYYNYGSVADTDIVYPYGGFKISGGTVETFAPILAWRGSGSINVTGSVYIVFNLSAKIEANPEDTINISGSSKCLFSLGHVGSGSISNIGKKIEKAAYSYNTSSVVPYGTADYQFISSAPDLTPDYGTVTEPGYGVTDFGSIENLEYAYPFGTLKVTNAAVQRATAAYRGSGSLFAIGGEGDAYSRIARSETQLFVVSGNLKESFSKGNYAGSGSLFTFRSLTETSAVNPPATGLFRISGIAKERATDSWLGTGSITLQTGIYPEYLYYRPTPRYVTVSGTSYISGSASTEYHSTYTNVGSGVIYNSGAASTPRTRPFIGAGVEFISGNLKESFSKGNYAGSGSLFAFNSLTESSTKVLPSETRLYTTSGQATTTRSEAYQGTGSLFTAKGIAESFAYSVPSETQLFKVSGVATTLHTNNFAGTGSLFTFKSAAESTTAIAPTETQLFKVSGTATASYNTVYTSSVGGTEFISGAATDVIFVPSFTGSGSLFAFNGLTESSTRTLPSETRLYRVLGAATTIRSGSYIGSGTEFITSNTATSNTIIYSGSGSLFTLKSATESKTDVSTSTVLFKFNGSAGESFIRTTYYGSGKVSLLRGAAESSTVRVPPETQLFRITGVSTQSTTKGNYTASGSEFVSGLGTESARKIYTGSGSLFTFKSATESSSFVPVSEITDIKIYGSATTTHTESYQTTGTTFVYNSAHISRTYPTYNGSGTEFISGAANQRAISSYSGNGNITEFGGSAQSTFTAIPSETLLYRISGTAATSFNSVYTAETSGQFSYTGNADLLRRHAFTGSGSLFAVNSATITQRVVIVVETNLFKISGGERNSYTRISIFEGGQINTSGKSADEKVSFTPARIFGTII
jgi:hypothetical protein